MNACGIKVSLHHRALGAGSLSHVQQTGRPGSQRSAAPGINRHEPLARMFSAAREAAHGQISTNQKQCQSEPLSLWAPSGSGPIQEEQIPPGLGGQEDKQEKGRWRSSECCWMERKKRFYTNMKQSRTCSCGVLLWTFARWSSFYTLAAGDAGKNRT